MTAEGTRKSRKTGAAVKPQRATSSSWFATFMEWSVDRQAIAIEALEGMRIAKMRTAAAPEPVQAEVIE